MNAPASLLQADLSAIADFLRESVGSAFHLVAITPDGPITSRHFGDDVEAAAEWARAENMRRRGLYWTVNRVREDCNGKPEKKDIVEARFAHVDIDPPKDGAPFDKTGTLDRLADMRAEPSFVIDTGGGLAAFWRLDDPAANLPAIEAINAGIADAFEADRCHNIDRLMRLPGTINWPNRKKIASGRQPAPARLITDDQGTVHEPMALAAAFPRQASAPDRERATVDGPYALLNADALGLGAFDPLRSLIERPSGRDRSTDALACAGRMARSGYTDEQILGVLMNPANAVHAHIGDQRDPRYQALRCIEAARSPSPGHGMTRTLQHDDYGADAGIYEEAPPEAFELADLTLWARTPPTPKAFYMAPYLPSNDVIIVTGDGGTNKSTLALQISACSAAGKQMLGMDVAPGPALYLTAEDDQRENHWRLAKIAAAIGTTLDALAGRLHVASLRGRLNNELATFESDGKLRTTPAYKMLRATIEQTGAKLVTLDNVAHLFAGNENDRSQVTAFINLLYQLCGDLGVTILLIAHRNKNGDTYSGSTAWLNAVRSQVLMERSEDGEPDVRRMSLGKANYARAGEEITFRWHDFALVRDVDLTPGMAQQIAEITAANAANARFLKCLAAVTARRETAGHIKGTNYAPRKFAGMAEAEGMREKQFEQAMERLLHLGQIRPNQQLWQDGNRHWKHGLKLASECVDPPAPTPRADLREPPAQTPENTAATLRAATPPYINIPGAALEAAAPHQSNHILAPGERGDDVEF